MALSRVAQMTLAVSLMIALGAPSLAVAKRGASTTSGVLNAKMKGRG